MSSRTRPTHSVLGAAYTPRAQSLVATEHTLAWLTRQKWMDSLMDSDSAEIHWIDKLMRLDCDTQHTR